MLSKDFMIMIEILPLIKTVVGIIEESADGISGEEKKARALEFLNYIWRFISSGTTVKIKEIQGIPFEANQPLLSMLIDAVVSLYNTIGKFVKK